MCARSRYLSARSAAANAVSHLFLEGLFMTGTGYWRRNLAIFVLGALCVSPALALQPRTERLRFDNKTIDPPPPLAIRATSSQALSSSDALRRGWDRFAQDNGGWQAFIDQRSGLPTLATGRGLQWFPLDSSQPPSLESLAQRARAFVAGHPLLLGSFGGIPPPCGPRPARGARARDAR
jgi:hypothetical protein